MHYISSDMDLIMSTPAAGTTGIVGTMDTNVTIPIPCAIMDDEKDAIKLFTHFCEAYVEPTMFASGVITNILAFIVLQKMPISKAVKALLCTVCITDFLTSLFGLISTVLEIVWFCGDMIYGYMVPGVLPVFITYKIYLMFLGMSSAILIFTSIMRTHSIINPFDWRNTFTKRRTVKMIIAIVIVTFIVFWPSSLYVMWKACFREIGSGSPSETCAKLEEYKLITWGDRMRYYFGVLAITLGPGTVIANLVCLILLTRAIKQSVAAIMKMQNPNNTDDPINGIQMKKSMSINKMFYAVLIINTICIFPSCLQVVCLLIDPEKYIFNKTPPVAIIDIIAEVFLSVLSSYNFWLYVLINKDFRKKFLKIFCCKKSEKSTNSTESWHRVSRRAKYITEQSSNGLLTSSTQV